MICSNWSWCESWCAVFSARAAVWRAAFWAASGGLCQISLLAIATVAVQYFFQDTLAAWGAMAATLVSLPLVYSVHLWFVPNLLKYSDTTVRPWHYYLWRGALPQALLAILFSLLVLMLFLPLQAVGLVKISLPILLMVSSCISGIILTFFLVHRSYSPDGFLRSLWVAVRMAWGEWPGLLVVMLPFLGVTTVAAWVPLLATLGWLPDSLTTVPYMANVIKYLCPTISTLWFFFSTALFIEVYNLRKDNYVQ